MAQASWSAWLRAFEHVYADVGSLPATACPTCGAHTLRLVFTAEDGEPAGYASFWCDTSLDGIFTSRVQVLPGVPVIPFGLPPEVRRKHIPNYVIVPPASSDDDEVFTL